MSTKKWFELALPNPTADNFRVQLGCHLEEVVEMLHSVSFQTDGSLCISAVIHNARAGLDKLAEALKAGEIKVSSVDVESFVDGWADQGVTLAGLAHICGIPSEEVMAEVDRSNFSKFVEGKPVFNAAGKIAKGPDYSKPNLGPYLPSKVFW